MSEPRVKKDIRRLLPDMAWPADWIQHYQQQGYWQDETLAMRIADWQRRYSDRVALVEPTREWRYQTLIDCSRRFAGELHASGLRAGDPVVIQLPNSAEFIVALFAVLLMGAVPVLALPALGQREILHIITLAEARLYLGCRQLTHLDIPAWVEHPCAIRLSDEQNRFADCTATPYTDRPQGDYSLNIALLLLSGGTTGLPKLIARTHADYGYNFTASAALCGVDAEERYLAVLSMAHNFPLACPGILGVFARGGCVVIPATAAPEDAFDAIARHRVTMTALVPSLVSVWLEALNGEKPDLSSLRLLQVGGARLAPETAQRVLARFHCQLQQVFGMAEGLLNYTRLDDDLQTVIHTQGKPLCADDEILIVDNEGHPVAPGETGELLVRGPYTIRGYFRAQRHNQQAFAHEGFYRSGDRVRQRSDGYLIVEGRTKDVINRNGETIAADEIEDCLRAHPAIRDVAVIADHAGSEQEIVHAVVIAEGELTLPALRRWLEQQHLVAWKWPERLTLTSSFPLTPIGKVNKKALAASLS